MAFPRQEAVVPQRIGDVEVYLLLPASGSPRGPRGVARIEVVMSDGTIRMISAELADHFPATTINQLIGFMDSVRSKAIAEILPEGTTTP